MPDARSRPATSTRQAVADRPKDVLYGEVYDPLTIAWFAALDESPEVARLLTEAPRHDLLENLERFNALFHSLVDVSLTGMYEKAEDIVAVVSQYRDEVHWVGFQAPGPAAGPQEIRSSLVHKMKRNISLGVVEALICLESAYLFCRDTVGLTGEELAQTLLRSRQLYGSLALLHDEQERVRLTFLTGIDGYLMYPQVDYADVIEGRVRVPADKFVVSGLAGARRVRFVTAPAPAGADLGSPIKRCPAHRFNSQTHPDMTLNDVLWDLLISIYRGSGRFN